MKQVLVVSDSHRHNPILNGIFENHKDIDIILHCGDIQEPLDSLIRDDIHIVTGNTDFEDFGSYKILQIEDVKLIMTHGHIFYVEDGFEDYYQKAKEEGCLLAVYGHTHNPLFFQYDDVYFLNPGSVSFPRGGRVSVPTYAIMTIDGSSIDVNYYHAKTYENINHLVLDTQPEIKRKAQISKPIEITRKEEPKKEKVSFLKRLFGKNNWVIAQLFFSVNITLFKIEKFMSFIWEIKTNKQNLPIFELKKRLNLLKDNV